MAVTKGPYLYGRPNDRQCFVVKDVSGLAKLKMAYSWHHRTVKMTKGFCALACLAALTGAHAQSTTIDATAYPTLNAAVAACGTADQCTVDLKGGTYTVTVPVHLKNGVRLKGDGTATIVAAGGAVGKPIVAFGTSQVVTTLTDTMVGEDRAIRVADTGSLAVGDMVYIAGTSEIDQHVNEIVGIESSGRVKLRYAVPHSIVAGTPLERVEPVHSIGLSGLAITGTYNPFYFEKVRSVVVDNVTITDSQTYGVFRHGLRVQMRNSRMTNVGGGVMMLGVTDGLVANNTLENYRTGGIFFRASTVCQAVNNTSRSNHVYAQLQNGSSGDGITVYLSSDILLSGNNVYDASCYGMWIQLSQRVVVRGNLVSNSFTLGYYVDNSQECVVEDNVASDLLTAHGFGLNGGTSHSLVNNTSVRCVYGFVLLATQNPAYGKNLAVDCTLPEFLSGVSGLIPR